VYSPEESVFKTLKPCQDLPEARGLTDINPIKARRSGEASARAPGGMRAQS